MAEPAGDRTRRFPELTEPGRVVLVSPNDARGNVRIDAAHDRSAPEVVLPQDAHMTASAANGNLYITFHGTSPDGPGYEYVNDAEVRLPAGWQVEADLRYLHSEATGSFGHVDIASTTGAVALHGEQESAHIVTRTGDITVDRADNLTAMSDTGDIEYNAVNAAALDRINARTTKGEVVANGKPVRAAQADGRGDGRPVTRTQPGLRGRGGADRGTSVRDRAERRADERRQPRGGARQP